MSFTPLPSSKGPVSGPAQLEPPTQTPVTASAASGPLTYVFELYRGDLTVGGGTVFASSATAAGRTVEMTMAGCAEVRIIGHIPQRTGDRRAV